MKLHIERQGPALSVRIDEAPGQAQALLDAVRRCRQSAWACQLGDCLKVASIADRIDGDTVYLTLTPRPGVELDAVAIGQCLRLVLPAAAKA
jgi:hypothetical protein